METKPRVLVIGAGVAGMRASLSLADMGLAVYLIEKEEKPGGWSLQAGRMGPEGQLGSDIVATLLQRIQENDRIVIYTQAELIEKTGSIGDFDVKINVKGEEVSLNVGAIVVTTGFTPYIPEKGEYGWGTDGVVDLVQFRQMLAEGKLEYHGKPVRDVAFIYCVGSRQAGNGIMPQAEPLLLPLLLLGGDLYRSFASRAGDEDKADDKPVSPLP